MNPPRVFFSYSHDSAKHKKWVLDFSTTLRNRGVDAVLDQWDLIPGDDLPHFMETQLSSANFVLMICTEKYVEKANAGEGGVGYEKMIITSSMLSKIDSSKVIPIIRQLGTDHRPTFLRTKLYINFSNDSDFEYNIDDLLRVLLNSPLYEKPEIGKNPFKPMEGARPVRVSDGIKELMIAVAKCYEGIESDFIQFSEVIHSLSMHRLTLDKYIKEAIEQGLLNWEHRGWLKKLHLE
jgi:TIR domain